MYILKVSWIILMIHQLVVFHYSKKATVIQSIPTKYGYEVSFKSDSVEKVHTFMDYPVDAEIFVYKIGKINYIFSETLSRIALLLFILYIIVAFYMIPHFGQQS